VASSMIRVRVCAYFSAVCVWRGSMQWSVSTDWWRRTHVRLFSRQDAQLRQTNLHRW